MCALFLKSSFSLLLELTEAAELRVPGTSEECNGKVEIQYDSCATN